VTTSVRQLPERAGSSPRDADVAGDANVTTDLLRLLSNTRFAYVGRDKRKQTNLILSVGRAASQSDLEGIYVAEVWAGHAKNAKAAYNFIHNSRRALLDLLDKAPGTFMRARLFLTTEWQRPQPTTSPLPTDHATDASEICAECASEDPPLASTTDGAALRPIDVGENGTVLAGVETEHLESLVGCLTALDGRDANTRALRPMNFAGGQWTVQQDIHLLSRHYWIADGQGAQVPHRARQEQLPQEPGAPRARPRAPRHSPATRLPRRRLSRCAIRRAAHRRRRKQQPVRDQ
jgi:hypothetical protein